MHLTQHSCLVLLQSIWAKCIFANAPLYQIDLPTNLLGTFHLAFCLSSAHKQPPPP